MKDVNMIRDIANSLPTSGMDIIPDLHADPQRLKRSLGATTPGAGIGFLGDFIDAGKVTPNPDDPTVLSEVRKLIVSGRAIAVMGNHELNAILFHRTNSAGAPLRSHSAKNLKQHMSFIDAFGIRTNEALAWTDWFLTLPLWLDLGDLRLVHACWDKDAIETISNRRPDGRLQRGDLEEVAAKKTDFAKSVDRLLTGPEIALPGGYTVHDTVGHERDHVRLAWWRPWARTWADATLSVPDPTQLPDQALVGAADALLYPQDAPPVFVGHYKMNGVPQVEANSAICLDYPSRPCLYQWRGETGLKAQNLIEIP